MRRGYADAQGRRSKRDFGLGATNRGATVHHLKSDGPRCIIHTVYTWYDCLSGEAVKRTGKRATARFALKLLP